MEQDLRCDLTRTVLAIVIIGGLIVASVWILRPFLAAIIWSTMIVVSTWPILRALQSRLWGKRWLAITVMTAALLLVFVIPFAAAIGTIVANAGTIVDWANRLSDVQLPCRPTSSTRSRLSAKRRRASGASTRTRGRKSSRKSPGLTRAGLLSWFVSEAGDFGL